MKLSVNMKFEIIFFNIDDVMKTVGRPKFYIKCFIHDVMKKVSGAKILYESPTVFITSIKIV